MCHLLSCRFAKHTFRNRKDRRRFLLWTIHQPSPTPREYAHRCWLSQNGGLQKMEGPCREETRRWKIFPFISPRTVQCTLVLYMKLIKTDSVLILLLISSVMGWTLSKDTANGRATTHQLYISAIEVWDAPILWIIMVHLVYSAIQVVVFSRKLYIWPGGQTPKS